MTMQGLYNRAAVAARRQHRLTDWRADWLTDWLTGWFAGWLTDWLADWLPDWLTGWLTHWLIDQWFFFLGGPLTPPLFPHSPAKLHPGNTEDNTQARHYEMREGPKNRCTQNSSNQVAAAWSFLELKQEAVGAKKQQGSSANSPKPEPTRAQTRCAKPSPLPSSRVVPFTALAASLLCEDTSSHNNVDGFLPLRSEILAHMPREPAAPSRTPAPS